VERRQGQVPDQVEGFVHLVAADGRRMATGDDLRVAALHAVDF
jgi:hypothetical protein